MVKRYFSHRAKSERDLVRKLGFYKWHAISIMPYTMPSLASYHTDAYGLMEYGIEYWVGYHGWLRRDKTRLYCEKLGTGWGVTNEERKSVEMYDVMSSRFRAISERYTCEILMFDADGNQIPPKPD